MQRAYCNCRYCFRTIEGLSGENGATRCNNDLLIVGPAAAKLCSNSPVIRSRLCTSMVRTVVRESVTLLINMECLLRLVVNKCGKTDLSRYHIIRVSDLSPFKAFLELELSFCTLIMHAFDFLMLSILT